jgi:hypothetical protein
MRISKPELILMVLVTITLFLVLANCAPGGPLGSDVVGYINHGINGVEDARTVNRYFHTFLQGIFARLAPRPLIGVQYYWAFLIASTTLLVYLNARWLSRRGTILHGALAVLLFWAIGEIAHTAGVTQVDIPAMFVASLIILVFLVSARQAHRSKWLIMLLGLLFYFGLRAKEVVACTFLLAIDLALDNDRFDGKLLAKRLGYLACGAAAGIVIFIVMNTIFLHDPLFGLRWSDYQEFLGQYGGYQLGSSASNWFTAPLTDTSLTLLILLLFTASGIRAAANPEFRLHQRLVWLVPLAMIALLAFGVGSQWALPFRYLLPPLAIMVSLGVQILDFEWPPTWRGRAILAGIFAGGMLLYLIARLLIKHSMAAQGWDVGLYLESVFFPILLAGILAMLMLSGRLSTRRSMALSVLILAILASYLASNLRRMFIARPNQAQVALVFYPLAAFAEDVTLVPEMQIYMASDTWSSVDQWWIAKNHEEMTYLFNVYFDAGLSRDQVTSPEHGDIARDILQTRYNYVWMRTAAWEAIAGSPQLLAQVEQGYEVFTDPQGLLVLLRSRNP